MSERTMLLTDDGDTVQFRGTDEGAAHVEETSAADILAAAAAILAALGGVLDVALATEDLAINRLLVEQQAEQYVSISATGLICTGAGRVMTILPTAGTNSPTIKLWDNTGGSGPVILDTCPLVPGVPIPLWACVKFETGLYVTLGGTNTAVSIFYSGGD